MSKSKKIKDIAKNIVKVDMCMKVSNNDIVGEVLRDNDTYTVIDNTFLNNLTLSKTLLKPLKHTKGHSHAGLEEIYFFLNGNGRIKLGDEFINVTGGDVILINEGVFHQVFNDSEENVLEFNCVFQKYNR